MIDFIQWHWRDHYWPAFNIADCAVVGGAIGITFGRGMSLLVRWIVRWPTQASLATIVADVKKQGILMGRMGRRVPGLNNVLTLAPALVVTKAEIDATIKAIGVALGNLKPTK